MLSYGFPRGMAQALVGKSSFLQEFCLGCRLRPGPFD